jgi:transposase
MQYIAFDSHKKYTFASVEARGGDIVFEGRIVHRRGGIRNFLKDFDKGSSVAIETIGNWYWIVDEIEEAGFLPKLVNAGLAKKMMGLVNKTDRLDTRGMNVLQRVGTLPEVWIPPGEVRDRRELFRTRMVLVRQRTALKNRIHSVLSKHGVQPPAKSDMFGKTGLAELKELLKSLPPQTRFSAKSLLKRYEQLDREVAALEKRMKKVFKKDPNVDLLMTMPGVGFILGVIIAVEVGDVERFPRGESLASYAGTTARVHASGDKTRFGRVRPDANRYLKWAFMEAANAVARHRFSHPYRHASRLYNRVFKKKNHQKAIGAVARHLAEAAYHVLKKGEPYRDPCVKTVLSPGV